MMLKPSFFRTFQLSKRICRYRGDRYWIRGNRKVKCSNRGFSNHAIKVCLSISEQTEAIIRLDYNVR